MSKCEVSKGDRFLHFNFRLSLEKNCSKRDSRFVNKLEKIADKVEIREMSEFIVNASGMQMLEKKDYC